MNIFKKKTQNNAPAATGSVEDVMKKYDRESNTREWEGVPKIIVTAVLALFSLFCIYVTLFGNFLEQVRLTSFVALIVLMGFLVFPHKKGVQRVNYMPWFDIVLMVLGTAAFLYYTFNADAIIKAAVGIQKNPLAIIIGIVGIIALAEVCRRSVGIPILVVATLFIIYGLYNYNFNVNLLVYKLFYADTGILSTPINVCSKYIVVFIIFGAFLERTGISDFFIDLANSVAGSTSGGPAKVAVISSALCGMVSGSSVGNTVTTGSVTIPMMKKTGYKGEFAGAVEAASSTGGQIMPPIMGAAAFLMAEYAGVPYSNIITRAILPAVLYFAGIFICVHLEAKKLGLNGLSKEQLPIFKHMIKKTYLLLPIVLLVWLVATNMKTMQFAASVAILAAIFVSLFNKKNRITPKKCVDALAAGGKGTITVGAACGMAGIIAGVISMTGLGSIIITEIVAIAGNTKIIALFLTMICCIILGMGVPTTANYCIMASTCAPILIQMGIPALAAHFFVFYFGIVADITPPVALAAYAGSAIAKSNPMRTAVNATKLAIAAFIVPYVFAYNPALLFIDTNALQVIQIALSALIGIFGVSAGLEGYIFRKTNIFERLIIIAGGLALIYPGTLTDIIGVAVVLSVVVIQFIGKKTSHKKEA